MHGWAGVYSNILCLSLHHVEDNLVPLPHALSVRRADVVLNDDLPLPAAEPAPHEALHLGRHKHESSHGCNTLAAIVTRGRKQARQHKSTRSLGYLLYLFDIRIFVFMDDMVRPHSFLGFIQGHNLLTIRGNNILVRKSKRKKKTKIKVYVLNCPEKLQVIYSRFMFYFIIHGKHPYSVPEQHI